MMPPPLSMALLMGFSDRISQLGGLHNDHPWIDLSLWWVLTAGPLMSTLPKEPQVPLGQCNHMIPYRLGEPQAEISCQMNSDQTTESPVLESCSPHSSLMLSSHVKPVATVPKSVFIAAESSRNISGAYDVLCARCME